LSEEQIAKFEVAMDNLFILQVAEPLEHLLYVALHFDFVQFTTPFKKLIKGLVFAELHKHINIVVVFEEMLKRHN